MRSSITIDGAMPTRRWPMTTDAHDDHGHDDHHVSEPPAQGSRAAELITTGLLFVSAALSWVVLVDIGFLHHDVAGSRCFPGSIPAICRWRGRCASTR